MILFQATDKPAVVLEIFWDVTWEWIRRHNLLAAGNKQQEAAHAFLSDFKLHQIAAHSGGAL